MSDLSRYDGRKPEPPYPIPVDASELERAISELERAIEEANEERDALRAEVAGVTQHSQMVEAERDELAAEVARLTQEREVCGRSLTTIALSANKGCGGAITGREIYRCTECSVPFHRDCARKHFGEEREQAEATAERLRTLLARWLCTCGPADDTDPAVHDTLACPYAAALAAAPASGAEGTKP